MELTLGQALQKAVEAHKAGQIQEADRLYTAILQAQPKHPDANHNMGLLAVGVGKLQESLPFFKTALEANPSIGHFWLSYIDALIKSDKVVDAKAVLAEAKGNGIKGEVLDQLEQKLNAQNGVTVNMGLDNSDHDQTRANILDSLKLDQALRLAKKKIKDESPGDANRIYDDILARFPKNKKAIDGIKSLSDGFIDKASKVQDPSQDQIQTLISLYQQGQLQQVLDSTNQLLKLFPNSLALYNIQGAAHAGLGQFDSAIDSYKQAIRIKPDYVEAYNNMGLALNDKGDVKAAIDSFKKAVKIKPDYAEAHNNMGTTLQSKGDRDSAIDSYKQALKIKPDYAEAHNNMGLALKDRDDLEGAIESYKQAIKIKPDYAESYNNMGLAQKNQGEFQASEKSLRKSIILKPNVAETHINLGFTLRKIGRLESAETSYRQAIALKPNFAEAYSELGITLASLGRLEQAEVSYRHAIALKPDFSEAYYNLGLLFLEVNQYEEAAKRFKFSDIKKSKYYLLRCLYLQDKKSLFYDQLDYFIDQGEIHPLIGSLVCRSALKYGIDKPNLFCKDPLNYVLKTDLSDRYNFEKIFVKTANTILNEKRILSKRQVLLTNGYQTSGNLFNLEHNLTKDIQNIIRLEIKKYLVKFNGSKEGFITNWPTNYGLNGWLVSMKSGGELRPHMHEKGWISGSIYINVPEKSKTESGNLVVCIEEEQLKGKYKNQEKSIDVVTGSLCLFPASLLHYTIPFESEEERIVLAFDVVPKY